MQLDEKISKNLAERKPRRLDKTRPPGYTMDSSGRWFGLTVSSLYVLTKNFPLTAWLPPGG